MKILVTGSNGQLGHEVMNELLLRGHEAIGCGSKPSYSGTADHSPVTKALYCQMNVTDPCAVGAVMDEVKPEAIVHCAAWTAVDSAELPENREKAWALNVRGTQLLAEACAAQKAKMIYISTDYVFDGSGERPWKPDSHECRPLNYYGLTKRQGELAVSSTLDRFFVVRTAWLFGMAGNSFVKTMLKLGKTHPALRVVNDQIGTPTYAADLGRLLADMVETDCYGTYHASNEGPYVSWYDFAKEIFRCAADRGFPEYAERVIDIQPVSSAEYGASIAKRPLNSRLDKSKLTEKGFRLLPDWRDSLNTFMNQYFAQEGKEQGR